MANSFSDEIFDPAFVFEGPHLVEASAGTGKTYNIQNIYARLVIEKDLHVAEIQVMTFTEAATKELRDRIRKVLVGMSDLYAGRTNATFMLSEDLTRYEKLRACARANLGGEASDATAQKRIEQALMEFDQAAISTIHGFCGRVLKRFAFETNGNFQADLDNGRTADLRQKIDDWWRNGRKGVPDEIKDGLDREELQKHAGALSGKADWTVDAVAKGDAAGWMLEKAASFVDEYESERLVREAQTFDDLLRLLREALNNGERGRTLAVQLRQEFKAALIDEFQDTDPVQYDIFRLIFLAPEASATSCLFFVGDPKQAIYSFRGGDIFAYKCAATSENIQARTFRLNQNHRSTPRLVQAVNAIFKDVDGSPTFGDAAIGYPNDLEADEKITALKGADGSDDPSPFRIVTTATGGKRDEYVTQAVLEVLKEQRAAGIGPKDIALLVSSHDAARKFQLALRDFGVQAVLQKSGNVFASPVASEFRQVLLAMARTGGAGQIRTALATSFFETSVAEIEDSDRFAAFVALFNDLDKTWRTKGFEAAFGELERQSGFRWRMARHPDGERRLADIFQLLDLAGAAIREIGPSPDALIAWVTDRINGAESGEADADEYARQLESEEDALKIMTMHASKGLQFPVVIVPLTRSKTVDAPYFYHDSASRLCVGLTDEAAAASQSELNQEQTRLYYVAFTRAKQRTIVITPRPEDETPLGKLFANACANGAGKDDPDSPIQWVDDPVLKELEPYTPGDVQEVRLVDACTPRHYSSAPTMGSYSSLVPSGAGESGDGHDVDDGEYEAETSADEHPVFALRGGKKTGTCWHAILEAIPFDIGDAELLAKVTETLRIHGCASKDENAAANEAALVAEMVRKTLVYPLESPTGTRFTLCDIAWADRLMEWEFDFSSASAAERTDAFAAILREEWSGDASKQPFLDALEGWNRFIPKGYFVGF